MVGVYWGVRREGWGERVEGEGHREVGKRWEDFWGGGGREGSRGLWNGEGEREVFG